MIFGASGRSRTGTALQPRDFKSLASTNFATEASITLVSRVLYSNYKNKPDLPDNFYKNGRDFLFLKIMVWFLLR